MSALVAAAGGEKTKLDGTWTATGGSSDGKKLPAEIVEKLTLVLTLKDNTYVVTIMGKEIESGTWKLDEKAKPKALDLTIVKGKDEGKKQLGILKLEGDVMTVAFGKAGGDARPKNFDGGDGIEVTILKRGK
jgi:uncharacterized protein (TIGR03067 family)